MAVRSSVRRDDYRDSVVLMRVSQQLEGLEGVRKASAMMATDNNKKILKEAGLLTDEISKSGPNDLVISVEAATAETAVKAISVVDALLSEKITGSKKISLRNLNSAMTASPESNLVLVSIPGTFASREAMSALKGGKHVFIFSDGVAIDEELKLKKFGEKNGLLVMGPDCGTAIINGVGLGFSNVVRRGPVGIVGASGTGIQQVSSLADEVGVSQAIGTGSNDLKEAIGAMTTRMGLRLLDEDPETKVVVIISKPPAPKVSRQVLEMVKKMKKPVVVDFIGGAESEVKRAGAVPAKTLEEAAAKAIKMVRGDKFKSFLFSQKSDKIRAIAKKESKLLKSSQRYIRGLFSGGTFCYESMLLLQGLVGEVYSNTPLQPKLKLSDFQRSRENTCIDMGTGMYTVGRPHPMIDFRFRRERLLKEAADPETAVVLLDIVLGYGANIDPAGEISPAIKESRRIAKREGRHLPVVVTVCGTCGDPQGLKNQEEKLREAGAVLMPSNAQAARMAALIATRGKIWGELG